MLYGTTWEGTHFSEEAEKSRGVHGQESLLWSPWEGTGEAG